MRNFKRRSNTLQDGTIALDYSHSYNLMSYTIPFISFIFLLLLLMGISAQFSAGSWRFALGHIIKWAIALSCSFILSRCTFKQILHFSFPVYIILCILLGYVNITGWVSKGAQRWIDLGFIHIEPSEFFKIALPLMLTKIITDHKNWNLFLVLKCLGYIAPVFFLILKQPDLGTGMLVLLLSITTMLSGGMPWLWVLTPLLSMTVIAPYLWRYLHVYQQNRIINLFNPESDPLGTGYHILQSIIAVGSGGWFGKGFLKNTQSQLEYLPEHATDFVFALWAEEWGFIGSIALIFLFATLTLWLLNRAILCKDIATSIILQVISVQLALSSLINIAMVLGLLPVVGVPLPIISLGGSNALMNGIGIGIALCCLRRIKIERSFS